MARRFGKEGFAVGLISRHQGRLDALAAELEQDGVQAKGFAADVRDPASIAAALEQVTETLGPIEVLQYSPLPQKDFMRPVLETTPGRPRGAGRVLDLRPRRGRAPGRCPGMRFLADGATPSILFVNGGSAVKPGRNVTGTSVAFAGQAAYAELLHEVLGEEGIYVGQLIIGGRDHRGRRGEGPRRAGGPDLRAAHQARPVPGPGQRRLTGRGRPQAGETLLTRRSQSGTPPHAMDSPRMLARGCTAPPATRSRP